MPLASGLASKLTIGAKTWRPRPAEEIAMEAESRKATELEELRLKGMEKKMETMETLRKLEDKAQRLNDVAASAELRAEAAGQETRERAAAEAKRRELARMELAKREGLQNLSEAELNRIRRERMKAVLLARSAESHAASQPMLSHLDLAGFRPATRLPPLPVPPPPPRTPRSSISPRVDPLPQPIMSTLPPPSLGSRHHTRMPSEPGVRLRRLSGGTALGAPPLVGLGRGNTGWGLPSRGLRGGPPPPPGGIPPQGPPRTPLRGPGLPPRHRYGMPLPRNADRTFYRDVLAERALKMQAALLRRRRLGNLDMKARQNRLRAQALRELRQRDFAARLRELGLQQREIESQVRLMGERERALSEAQLRELRERDHRLQLKELGLQEREILEQLRHRDEMEREALRVEAERLERDLRHEELADAERAIRRAMERKEAPPLGITRPSLAEMRAEGFIEDELMEGFQRLDERERRDILAEDQLEFGDAALLNLRPRSSAGLRARTPLGGHRHTLSVGGRTPLTRDGDVIPGMTPRQRDDLLLQEQSMRDRLTVRDAELAAMTPRMRDAELLRSARTPSMMDDLEFAREREGLGMIRPSSRGSMRGDILRPSSRASVRDADLYGTGRREPLALPMAGRMANRGGLTAEELGLGSLAERERVHLNKSTGSTDALLQARLDDAAHNREVNGGRRSRAASRAAEDAFDNDLRRAELASELGSTGYNAASLGLSGRARSRAPSMSRSAADLAVLDAQEAALRDREMRNRLEMDAEFGGFSGRQADNALARLDERDLDLMASNAARRGLSIERPSSRIERELYEHEGGSQLGGFGSGLVGYSDAELDQMSDEEFRQLWERKEAGRIGYGESPPFGGAHGGLGADLAATRYARSVGGSPRGRIEDSHGMPGGFSDFDAYGDGNGDMYGEYDGYGAEEDYGENDFTVTEHMEPEDPNVRIVTRLGRVEAESYPARGDAAMHDAVNNLITAASRRGANGVVALRVSDGANGSFIASGEAVVIS